MKALMFADWAAVKKTLVRNLLLTLVIVSPVVAMSNSGTKAAPGIFAASMVVVLLSIYAVLALFGADEAFGWESFRLALPVSAADVVRSRYMLVACMVAVFCVLATLMGVAVELLTPMAGDSLVVPRGALSIMASAVGGSAVALLYSAIEMPLFFRFGISKARMASSAPFFLFLLLLVEPVQTLAKGAAKALEAGARSLASPLPVLVIALGAVAALYLLSMYVSQRLYSTREF